MEEEQRLLPRDVAARHQKLAVRQKCVAGAEEIFFLFDVLYISGLWIENGRNPGGLVMLFVGEKQNLVGVEQRRMYADRLTRMVDTPLAFELRISRRLRVDDGARADPLERLIAAPVMLHPVVDGRDEFEISEIRRPEIALNDGGGSESSGAEDIESLPVQVRTVVVAPQVRQPAACHRHNQFEVSHRPVPALKKSGHTGWRSTRDIERYLIRPMPNLRVVTPEMNERIPGRHRYQLEMTGLAEVAFQESNALCLSCVYTEGRHWPTRRLRICFPFEKPESPGGQRNDQA
jgi:hypothetical protein